MTSNHMCERCAQARVAGLLLTEYCIDQRDESRRRLTVLLIRHPSLFSMDLDSTIFRAWVTSPDPERRHFTRCYFPQLAITPDGSILLNDERFDADLAALCFAYTIFREENEENLRGDQLIPQFVADRVYQTFCRRLRRAAQVTANLEDIYEMYDFRSSLHRDNIPDCAMNRSSMTTILQVLKTTSTMTVVPRASCVIISRASYCLTCFYIPNPSQRAPHADVFVIFDGTGLMFERSANLAAKYLMQEMQLHGATTDESISGYFYCAIKSHDGPATEYFTENMWLFFEHEGSPDPGQDRHLVDLRDEENRRIDQQPRECPICLTAISRGHGIALQPCGHYYCIDCIRGHVSNRLEARAIPTCPTCAAANTRGLEVTTLNSDFARRRIKISDEEYNVFVDLELAHFSVELHCRKCDRYSRIDKRDYADNTSRIVSCQQDGCYYIWCNNCDQEIQADDVEHSCPALREVNELARQKGWKPCPGCQTMIEKVDGCDHMKCTVADCNTQFCYLCGDAIVKSQNPAEISLALWNHACLRETDDGLGLLAPPVGRDRRHGGPAWDFEDFPVRRHADPWHEEPAPDQHFGDIMHAAPFNEWPAHMRPRYTVRGTPYVEPRWGPMWPPFPPYAPRRDQR